MTFRTIAQVSTCLATMALVAACATKPEVTSSVEAGQYRSHAGRSYTPPGPPGDPWGPYISEAAAKYDVPERWVREVMRQESGGRLYGHGGDLITSGAGAMGLMQVMPATYDDLRARYSELGDDPFDPHNNILAGTAYIREMYDIYGSPGFLAAYNAGPGRLDDYLTRNRVLPLETRRYVASIGPRIAGSEPRTASPGAQYALNALPFNIPDGPRYAPSSRYNAPSDAAPAYASAAPAVPIVLNPPVQMAQVQMAPVQMAPDTPAPSASPGPYIVLRPQPVEVAEAAPAPVSSGGPYVVLRPQPVEVADATPRTVPAAAPALRPLPTPPAPAFVAPVQVAQAPSHLAPFAQIPEPPRPVPPPAYASREPSQRVLASAALVPLSPPRGGFSLITPANAEPLLRHPTQGYGGGNWAVQVGAYGSESLAASATASARDHARDVLGPARSSVSAVHQPRGTLFRARLTGLSRDAAAQACERLAHARTSCMVVSPDAQL